MLAVAVTAATTDETHAEEPTAAAMYSTRAVADMVAAVLNRWAIECRLPARHKEGDPGYMGREDIHNRAVFDMHQADRNPCAVPIVRLAADICHRSERDVVDGLIERVRG